MEFVKANDHSLHKICSRICSLPTKISSQLIIKYSKNGDFVLDPFSGKGSVPLEACINGRIGIGNDVSPEAYVLTTAKTKPIKLEDVESFLQNLDSKIKKMVDIQIETNLDKNARIFYSKKTFDQILKIRKLLSRDDGDLAMFVKAIMCGILHGNTKISLSLRCSHSFSMSPNYVKNYARRHGLIRPNRDVIQCLRIKAQNVLKDGTLKIKGKSFSNDARKLPLYNESINLIITSPPYFNLNTYAWDNWLRLWFLGHDYKDVNKKLIQTESETKYRDFMKDSIKEMYRVLKKNSFCFIIVGDVKLKGRKINTAKFLSPCAEEAGFVIDNIEKNLIPKYRKVFTYLPENKGIDTDRILCLRKS